MIALVAVTDRFSWLPPHMRDAARRHGFGLRRHAQHRFIHVESRLWYTDGAAAVSSDIDATGQRPHGSDYVQGLIGERDREPATPRTEGEYAAVGCAIVATAYIELATELWPGATWEAGGGLDPVVAYVGQRAVALVMPIDPTADEAPQ